MHNASFDNVHVLWATPLPMTHMVAGQEFIRYGEMYSLEIRIDVV